MISCEEAALICNKQQYEEATLLENIKLRIHLAFCKVCAEFTKKNVILTSLCNKANLQTISETDKSQMKQRMQENL